MSEREEKLRIVLFNRFEQMGETEVRLMDATPNLPPASEDIRYSRAWLALRDADKRDAREEATLSKAKLANIISIVAIISSIVMAIISIFALQNSCK